LGINRASEQEREMYQVIIKARGSGGEIEWTKIIKSPRSLRGAKAKATKWIRKNLFTSDYTRIDKSQVGPYSKRADWEII
jgi:hypothetical protein